jgi:2-polyprenyl-3-methyl-5-hydroxy-6-metoxy-1,4-benzoquinol methylase
MITDNIKEKVYYSSTNSDVLSLIPSNAHVILDAGCGPGSLARELKARGCLVDGITISETELQEAGPFLRSGYLRILSMACHH